MTQKLAIFEGVCQQLKFDETHPPMPEVNSDDEEYLPTADLDDTVWSEEPVPDSWECLCIHEIPRPVTPPLQLQPNEMDMPATPSPQPDQVEMPSEPELMELYIPEDILDLKDVPEEKLLKFDAWHTMCWTVCGSMTIHMYIHGILKNYGH